MLLFRARHFLSSHKVLPYLANGDGDDVYGGDDGDDDGKVSRCACYSYH